MGISIKTGPGLPSKAIARAFSNSNKISFGDWSASKYLWKDKKITRKEIIKTFGSPNPKKHNRYSWSGHVFPKYSDSYNYAGQRMKFLDNGNLIIEYSYLHDSRKEKENFKAELKKNETIVLAIWEKSFFLEFQLFNDMKVKDFALTKSGIRLSL